MKKEFERDALTREVIRCIIKVHRTLGPGFLESVYRKALLVELRNQGLLAETEKEITVYYQGSEVGIHRLDILVQNSIIIELKTVDSLGKIHYAQIRSYLKAANLEVGILVNFAKERADFRRVEQPFKSPSSPPYPHIPSSYTV